MNQDISRYSQIDINTSNPLKIVLMLYDGAITFLTKAVDYLEQNDIPNKNVYSNNAREIIEELNNSLNIEAGGELASNLRRLYFFMNRHLMKANWNNDAKGIREVIQMLTNLREGWQDAYIQYQKTNDMGQQPNSPLGRGFKV